MASKTLFNNKASLPSGMVFNEAGGIAYKMEPAVALAQYVMTGCLSNTFYASAQTQLGTVLDICSKSTPERVAKAAVLGSERGYMKDIPALLCVYLAAQHENDLLSKIFSRVINNGRMLRNFVQIMRSGVTGRKSFGSLPKRLIANWFNARTAQEVFWQSIGNDPSFQDILRLCHPRPLDSQKNALYRWFLHKEHVWNDLPTVIKQFEEFKTGVSKVVPNVPFDMLTAFNLGVEEWSNIAMRATWQWTRANLNTLLRHDVLSNPDMRDMIVDRLSNPDLIKKSKVFPYQIMTAFLNIDPEMPMIIGDALHAALEHATENVPCLHGRGYICIDVSGSMSSIVTGSHERGNPSVVRCIDVAALIASSILRKNPEAKVVPFNTHVVNSDTIYSNSVLTNASLLANMLQGGTDCASPLLSLNASESKGDWVVMVSDNQSWLGSLGINRFGQRVEQTTGLMGQWETFKSHNPQAKLVCLDLQPYSTTQVQDRSDILNIGGFTDSIFDLIADFLSGNTVGMVDMIDQVEL